jgi:hypothetical protein
MTVTFKYSGMGSFVRPSSLLLRRKLFSTNRAQCALAEYTVLFLDTLFGVMWRFLVPDVKPCHNSITYCATTHDT